MLKNIILNVDGKNWLVRVAVSFEAARNTIAMARVTGSVGGKDSVNDVVTADVTRLDDDGRECLPYGERGADHSMLIELCALRANYDKLAEAHEQAGLRNRVYAGALAQINAWATSDDPILQDAGFLRTEIAKEIAAAHTTIAAAKAEYLAAKAGSAA